MWHPIVSLIYEKVGGSRRVICTIHDIGEHERQPDYLQLLFMEVIDEVLASAQSGLMDRSFLKQYRMRRIYRQL